MKSKVCAKVEFVLKMIENLEKLIRRHQGIVNMLSDFEGEAASLMFLMQIGEELNKIYKLDSGFLEFVNLDDIKGAYAVRNFIAYDYEGVDLAFIENILRFRLDDLKFSLKSYKEKICY